MRQKFKQFFWIDRFPNWTDAVLKKHPNLSKADLENLVQIVFKFIHEKMSNPTYPIIRIKGFGAFQPSLKKLNFSMRMSIYMYRKGKAYRETVVNKIKRLWPIRKRIIAENNGAYTYRNWKQYHKASEGEDKIIYVSNSRTTTKYTDEELLILNEGWLKNQNYEN